jgi:nicotinamidase-related amidase
MSLTSSQRQGKEEKMAISKSVLVIMDFQEGIVGGMDSQAAVSAASQTLEAARLNEISVIFVRVAFRAEYPEVVERNQIFGGLPQLGDFMSELSPTTQIVSDLAPHGREPVAVKRRVSAFSGSDLDVLLRAAGAEELVLAGISTSGVVLSTVRQAADLDYRLVVLSDACADSDPEVHDILMTKVFPRQATVRSSDEWIASLAVSSSG